MKSFDQFFLEEFSPEKVAYVFDVDDTLVHTTDRIHVGKKSFSTDEWATEKNNLTPQEKTMVDLSEFSEGLSNAAPIVKNIEILIDLLSRNQNVFILTARGGGKEHNATRNRILKDLIDSVNDAGYKLHGELPFKVRDRLPISRVFTLADEWVLDLFKIPKDMTIAQQKAFFMKNILLGQQGFERVVFFDDDFDNIEAASKIPGVEAHKV